MAPILFKIGPISVHGYGLMVALGLLVCFPVLFSDARRKGLNALADNLPSLYLWMLAAGFVGGKIFYAWTSPEEFNQVKATKGLLATMGTGFVFYGSLVFCLPVLWWWLKKRSLPILDSIDTMIMAAPIMLGLGRVGCFLSGCCHGCRTDSWIGVTFRHGQGLNDVAIHPAQLYETFGCAVVFAILWFWARHRTKFPGYVTAVYFVLYGIERYVVELFRGDSVRGFVIGGKNLAIGDCPGFALSFSQAVSLIAIAAGALWLWKAPRRPAAAAKPARRPSSSGSRRTPA